MKKVIIKPEELKELTSGVKSFTTANRTLKLVFGTNNLGETIACRAVVVDDNSMLEKGFAVEKPEDYADTVYMQFYVSSKSFLETADALLNYNGNVTIAEDDNVIHLSVGNQCSVPLKKLEEDQADVEITSNINEYIVRMIANTNGFLAALRTGSVYVEQSGKSEDKKEQEKITEVVVIKLLDNKLSIYSSDGHAISKKVFELAKSLYNETPLAVAFLQTFGKGLSSKEDKKNLLNAMNEAKANNTLVDLAKEKGYESNPYQFSLTEKTVSAILKTFSGASENLNFVITANHLHIMGGRTRAVFTLANNIPTIYEKTVDTWGNLKYKNSVVIDKEELVKAIRILSLAGDGVPLRFTFDGSTNLPVVSGEHKVNIPIVKMNNNDEAAISALSPKLVSSFIATLPNGNLCISANTPKEPVKFSTSSSEGYILQIKVNK